MTLTATEKVYQADKMHLTPASDSQIYGYQGNWVLRGLELDILADSVVLHAGAAILQGRLYENSGDVTLSMTGITGTYYVGLQVDLSETNPDANTNNQYTLVATQTPSRGDLLSGDIQAFIPLWRVSGGVPSRVTLLYEEDTPLKSHFINGWSDTGDDSHIRRVGRMVVMSLSISKNTDLTNPVFIELDPVLRPSWKVWSVGVRNSGDGVVILLANPSGNVYPVFSPFSNDVIRGELTWLIDQPKQ